MLGGKTDQDSYYINIFKNPTGTANSLNLARKNIFRTRP